MYANYKNVTEEQNRTNPYAAMVPGQTIVEIPRYELECGEVLLDFPVAYKTWGRLNKDHDNVLLICHALTGSSDVQDWWGPLLGTGLTFDPSRFFIICINFLGSPYGSCSPMTIDKSTGKRYGPEFPLVTVKDDIGVQKLILDFLGVEKIACVIGGSMGGMAALEYSSTYHNTGYVKSVIALATAARALAWCISWNETQRQCIFSDPNYRDGYYHETPGLRPDSGLSAARMAALLTYRLRNSFETRFGRKLPSNVQLKRAGAAQDEGIRLPKNKDEESWLLHNDGARSSRQVSSQLLQSLTSSDKPQTYFTAQSYLRYQGDKFVARFDANCYISISRKLDTHDITRGHVDFDENADEDPLVQYLGSLWLPHLIIGITSDGLFTYGEQQLLGAFLPDNTLKTLDSPEGHDAFLLDFEIIDEYCREFLHDRLPEFYDDSGKIEPFENWKDYVVSVENGGNSVFGEAEKNITNW
ncbi:homoserine O-acetyltransferase [Metschnikowia bicuspidata var. bicuspidata NRRL YB-4993]|uniref:Homoserine O-acetyltransferase n=1 Tax=Metschnikowia bicuspidata var. bicuspidata NRRL YB-4993 TaxID=869754 RepID=A0A1A0HE82_9ASCO|nr:homoserine O-acetyltransferase [Metschnikowia bicuspidata var. bicuspidata NRRL YB-4993]OBA22419.1 homoserine O-acetyltransferase [Metschnikowia bicuspidata var. bicuspidata NRRL YB-4993]